MRTYFQFNRAEIVSHKSITDLEKSVMCHAASQFQYAISNALDPVSAISEMIERTRYLYLIKNESTGLVKIGITDNIKKRVATLENGSGCKCSVLFCVDFKRSFFRAYEAEQFLHHYFDRFRLIGEWFNLSTFSVLRAYAMIKSLEFTDYSFMYFDSKNNMVNRHEYVIDLLTNAA